MEGTSQTAPVSAVPTASSSRPAGFFALRAQCPTGRAAVKRERARKTAAQQSAGRSADGESQPCSTGHREVPDTRKSMNPREVRTMIAVSTACLVPADGSRERAASASGVAGYSPHAEAEVLEPG